eukprot:TRINITY_DN785_c0_g1_i1.p1 TRINITY_DN785_c0_g1~~TRINITY_DN785_c0_g1_i1.p1  ORF type:complete len:326 (-),score=123.97 TRINITY_DN785_c0_g1_i1:1015-1992(-)
MEKEVIEMRKMDTPLKKDIRSKALAVETSRVSMPERSSFIPSPLKESIIEAAEKRQERIAKGSISTSLTPKREPLIVESSSPQKPPATSGRDRDEKHENEKPESHEDEHMDEVPRKSKRRKIATRSAAAKLVASASTVDQDVTKVNVTMKEPSPVRTRSRRRRKLSEKPADIAKGDIEQETVEEKPKRGRGRYSTRSKRGRKEESEIESHGTEVVAKKEEEKEEVKKSKPARKRRKVVDVEPVDAEESPKKMKTVKPTRRTRRQARPEKEAAAPEEEEEPAPETAEKKKVAPPRRKARAAKKGAKEKNEKQVPVRRSSRIRKRRG